MGFVLGVVFVCRSVPLHEDSKHSIQFHFCGSSCCTVPLCKIRCILVIVLRRSWSIAYCLCVLFLPFIIVAACVLHHGVFFRLASESVLEVCNKHIS